MNEKQQQLLFDKGITNVPSDALCSDNALEESLGMVYDNGEHRVIQKPVNVGTAGMSMGNNIYYGKLIYVHRHANNTRYIFVYQRSESDVYRLFYKTSLHVSAGTEFYSSLTSDSVSVESVGKTLVVSTSSGLLYFLWNQEDGTYKYIGDKIPEYVVQFKVSDFSDSDIEYEDKFSSLFGMLDGIVVDKIRGDVIIKVAGSVFANDPDEGSMYENGKSVLIGLVGKRLNQVHASNRFAFPFWARSSMRLYDGSHIHISNPYLLLPTVRYNRNIFTCDDDGEIKYGNENDKPGDWPQVNYKPYYAKLYYYISRPQNYQDWEDIISGVDIYVSEEVKTFDMEGLWTIQNVGLREVDRSGDPYVANPYFNGNTRLNDACKPVYDKSLLTAYNRNNNKTWRTYFQPENYSDDDITRNLLDASVFYQILEIDNSDITNDVWVDATGKIRKNVLKNLKTQPQLEYDDYFSYSTLQAEVMKSYNARLHLANVKRSIFGGFTQFSWTAYKDNTSRRYIHYVYINTESGLRIAQSTVVSAKDIKDIWFYYPDPRAYKVDIFDYTYSKLIASLSLKEHHSLHGAYYFGRLPDDNETYSSSTASIPSPIPSSPEVLETVVMVSEADNPFVFTAKGEITTNLGAITGIATQTMSLGEQEHGIHPLTVFSKRGISVLRVDNEGTYSRVDEISREVCNNKASITETDGPVFFSSDKGLMVIVGNQVKCVSEQMSGRTNCFSLNLFAPVRDLGNFNEYLKYAIIAYDYRDSLLWIFNPSYGYCYVYSIKSGTFGRFYTGNSVTSVVNDYPDYLLQKKYDNKNIFSLLNRKDINNDEEIYNNLWLFTRPMKLENGLALKSIMQIRHVKDFKPYTVEETTVDTQTNEETATKVTRQGTTAMRLFASNNLTDWVKLTSLRGTPWKYYRMWIKFDGLKAIDRYSGTIIVTQERRTDKLR